MIPTAARRTTSLRATPHTPLKVMGSSHRINIKATNRRHTSHNRAAATQTRDLARQPGRTVSALLSMVGSRWAFKAINTGPTMRVTRKGTPDTSEFCLLQRFWLSPAR